MLTLNRLMKVSQVAKTAVRSFGITINPAIANPHKQCKICSAEEAVRCVTSGDRVCRFLAPPLSCCTGLFTYGRFLPPFPRRRPYQRIFPPLAPSSAERTLYACFLDLLG